MRAWSKPPQYPSNWEVIHNNHTICHYLIYQHVHNLLYDLSINCAIYCGILKNSQHIFYQKVNNHEGREVVVAKSLGIWHVLVKKK